jgi:hypothetical protein
MTGKYGIKIVVKVHILVVMSAENDGKTRY